VLLTHAGLLTQAEAVCRRLLAIDELSAAAHYVLALCREGTGDLGGAVHHDRIAVYLDPRFAMPRLHLGLLARRAGDLSTMHHELNHAVALFESEGSSRLLLFGGGFGREALVALCHAEMCGNRESM
jgi:chemotaxis protein methyltransferase CheR